MTCQTPVTLTIADAIARVEAQGTASQRQDIRKALSLFRLFGLDGASLTAFPCDPVGFEEVCPKYQTSRNTLVRLVAEAGLRPDTYKQLWRAARRLIDATLVSPVPQNSSMPDDDAWAELLQRIKDLQQVGLIDDRVSLTLSPMINAARTAGHVPCDLDSGIIDSISAELPASERKKIRRACRALDQMRSIPSLRQFLPSSELAPAMRQRSLSRRPAHLDQEIAEWIETSAREQVDPDLVRFSQAHSLGSRGVYQAALRSYVDAALAVAPHASRLPDLFTPLLIERVVTSWITENRRDERTLYTYAITLVATLGRTGHADAADYLHRLVRSMPSLRAGKAKSQVMSPKTKAWCRALLADPQKSRRFLSQHLHYYQAAAAALTELHEAGLDPETLAIDPTYMAALSAKQQSVARKNLQSARRNGVMAAYSAIAVEGAPLRRGTMLSLRWTGPQKTFFAHLQDRRNPHAIIRIPTEELKNGRAIEGRGEELEPIEIRRRSDASAAVDILRWYLAEIRPLFGGAVGSDCLFPPLSAARAVNDSLGRGTFDKWIARCSSSIDLPLTSHNFRHGQCSLYLADGRGSIDDLARLLGDRPETVRRYYAWIDGAKSHARVQEDIARRMLAGSGGTQT